jgi:hypothetical protein
MDKKEWDEKVDRLNRSTNDYKAFAAMTVAVDEVYRRHGEVSTPEQEKRRTEDLSKVWVLGASAFRMQIIMDLFKVLTEEGKVFNVPNNGEELKYLLMMAMFHGGKHADEATKKFMDFVSKEFPERICYEMTSADDPRVAPYPSPAPGEKLH